MSNPPLIREPSHAIRFPPAALPRCPANHTYLSPVQSHPYSTVPTASLCWRFKSKRVPPSLASRRSQQIPCEESPWSHHLPVPCDCPPSNSPAKLVPNFP